MQIVSQRIARTLGSARPKAALAAAALASAASAASATQIGTMITNVSTDGSAAVKAVIIIFSVIGVLGIGYGGLQMKKKGGDRGDDITAMKIFAPMIGGTICLCIALIAGMVANEMGGSNSNIGQQVQVGS